MRIRPRIILLASWLTLAAATSFGATAPPSNSSSPLTEPSLRDAAGGYDQELSPEELPSVKIPSTPVPQAPPMLDLTTPPSSLWTRIRLGFGLPDVSTPLVREQEEWYAARPDYIRRTIARSARYLHYIVEEVQKRRMPTEIALLPFIESAYNPVAYSRAHAAGIWQFIPSTGKHYGLQQNFWYDGRRDVMAATHAALDYLQKLYDMFGSWDLALASYNWGEGAVSRAIARNQSLGLPTDYLSLSMPTETRYYIPKLQAVKNIVANPSQYGIELAEVPNQPYFTAVTINRPIDVKRAASLAGVPLDEFALLNPAHNRPVIRATGEQTLLVPADRADTFLNNLENARQSLVSWKAYTLKRGETLERIAARYGVSVAELRQANGLTAKARVGAGSTILTPGGNDTAHLPDLPSPRMVEVSAPIKGGKFVAVARRTPAKKTAIKGKATGAKVASSTAPARKSAKTASTPAKGQKKILVVQRSR